MPQETNNLLDPSTSESLTPLALETSSQFKHESSGLQTPRRRERTWLHVALFLATVLTTMFWGRMHYAGFLANFSSSELPEVSWIHGAWYSWTILAILGTHELGHYYACRYYKIDASPPFFLPAPILTGTFGAVIRIRKRIPTKAILFDVGVAGPIAGFIVAVPTLFLGLWLSRITKLPSGDTSFITLGEPLLFQAAAWLVWGSTPEGYSINLHPMGFAAWFGLIATALNLFPIAQLDGGHISYAAFGRKSTTVTVVSLIALLGLGFVTPSWFVLASFLLIMMIVSGGLRHPPTLDEHVPLDRTRLWVAVAAVVIFALCFTPAPVDIGGLTDVP